MIPASATVDYFVVLIAEIIMGFDAVFQHIGEFGRYQAFIYVILGLCAVSQTMQLLAVVFLAAEPDHWCRVPRISNLPYQGETVKVFVISLTLTYSRK